MIKKATISTIAAVILASGAPAGHAAQLLLDGSFETPVVAAGTTGNPNPGLGTLPTGWTVTDGAGTVNSALSNLTHGIVTNGTGNTGSNNLPLDPYDSGTAQSLDISGDGTASHLFTAQFDAPVTVKIDFGGRDSGSASGVGSYWSIYNSAGTTLFTSSNSTPVNPGFGSWSTQTLSTTISLTANTQYRFVVVLANPDQVDGITITQVPEPRTLASVGIGAGLLGWMGLKRRRRA